MPEKKSNGKKSKQRVFSENFKTEFSQPIFEQKITNEDSPSLKYVHCVKVIHLHKY